jgi:hypothetical protein
MGRVGSRRGPKVARAIASLSAREERKAIAAALAYLAEKPGPLQKARLRVLGAEVVFQKAAKPQAPPGRAVRVLVADYSGRQVLQVLLDAEARVIESKSLHYQPALQPDETAEARSLASRDQRVKDLLRGRKHFVALFTPMISVEPGTRLVGLRYGQMKRGSPPTFLASAVVDLSTQEVRSFTRAPASPARN